jgi:uracil-DNA glycosylase
MFGWFKGALGASEEVFRQRVYMAAVLRCFPGKAAGGGDRKPSTDEIERCRSFLQREIEILHPNLVIPVGSLAIEQVLGHKVPLAEVVGRREWIRYHGVEVDVIALPHPSGASTWHRTEPGVRLLKKALRLIAWHSEVRKAFPRRETVTDAAARGPR